jgi:hypothetical protein
MKIYKKWIRAEEGSENSVIYYDEDGNKLIRYWKSYPEQPINEASTRSWRNNNPGNHSFGDFAKKNGAIGRAGKIPNKKNLDIKYAVYPEYETGRKAQALRLKEGPMYIDSTLNEFVRKYTGVEKEDPDTEEVINYRNTIKSFTKFDMNRTIRSLNNEEYERLLDAMKKHEGWRVGREEYTEAKSERQVKEVLGVRINKQHIITEFLVGTAKKSKWITKREAIAMAENGRLHATVLHSKKGTYLRAEYGSKSFKELAC